MMADEETITFAVLSDDDLRKLTKAERAERRTELRTIYERLREIAAEFGPQVFALRGTEDIVQAMIWVDREINRTYPRFSVKL